MKKGKLASAWALLALLLTFAGTAFATPPTSSAGPFLNQAYNWSALQTFSAGISTTTVNGVTITQTSNPAVINIQSGASGTGSIQIGQNQGTIGAEAIAIGLSTANAAAGSCGACTLIGQSILLNNTTISGGTAVGNDCDKFYTGNQAITCLGSGAAKNQVSGGNSFWGGDGAGINLTISNGPSNSNTVLGGNNTLAGTAGNFTVARVEAFGANIAPAFNSSLSDVIFIGANMLGSLTGGSHLIEICTYTASCPNPPSNNYTTLEGIVNITGTGTPATSTTTVAGNFVVTGTPNIGAFTGTTCTNSGFLTINDAAGNSRKVMICT